MKFSILYEELFKPATPEDLKSRELKGMEMLDPGLYRIINKLNSFIKLNSVDIQDDGFIFIDYHNFEPQESVKDFIKWVTDIIKDVYKKEIISVSNITNKHMILIEYK